MNGNGRFSTRTNAGKALAKRLLAQKFSDPVVLALPRGGVPVATEIALALNAPLDLVLVRKIGVPYQPELAVAAIVDGEHPEIVTNTDVLLATGLTEDFINQEAKAKLEEIERRRSIYLAHRPRVNLSGRDLILVDDGIATGATIRAAVAALKNKHPNKIVVAVPVAPEETIEELRKAVDEVICLSIPRPFFAISLHYAEFHQLADEEVVRLLNDFDLARQEFINSQAQSSQS